jgi:molybdopterin converting factor small subunit
VRTPLTTTPNQEPNASETKASISVRILYFATLAEQLQRDNEDLLAPSSAYNVGKLLAYLRHRGKQWEYSLDEKWVNVTINKQFSNMDTILNENDEIAIIPIWRS